MITRQKTSHNTSHNKTVRSGFSYFGQPCFFVAATFVLSFLHIATLNAELLGMVDGRTARLPKGFNLSVEAGVNFYSPQLQWSSARVNLKPKNSLLGYLDIAHLRASNLPLNSKEQEASFTGNGLGGGIVVAMPKVLNRFDFAFNASYRTAVVVRKNKANNSNVSDVSENQAWPPEELQQMQWSGELLVSPIDPLLENGLTWYATIGYISTIANFKTSAEPVVGQAVQSDYQPIDGVALGFGIVKPSAKVNYFVGVKYVANDPLLGIGVRYNIR